MDSLQYHHLSRAAENFAPECDVLEAAHNSIMIPNVGAGEEEVGDDDLNLNKKAAQACVSSRLELHAVLGPAASFFRKALKKLRLYSSASRIRLGSLSSWISYKTASTC